MIILMDRHTAGTANNVFANNKSNNKKHMYKKRSVRQPGLVRSRGRHRVPNALKSDQKYTINYSFDDNSSHSSVSNISANFDRNLLSNWSFPQRIHQFYATKGITKLFDWQVECLNMDGVLEGRNLVYSAPTSAGKTMVSDILMYKKLLEHKKKAIVILPFVSVTQEKVFTLKRVLRAVGVNVDAFAGGVNPRGGLARVDVAVCTIEKANNMINKLIEDNKLSEIGLIVVDELHMIGNNSRGFLLELLLTKVLYLKSKMGHEIQIVGMSATIPNLDAIAKWLNAALYVTDFRPVPLYERVNIGDVVYDAKTMTEYRRLDIKDYDIKKSDGSDDSNLLFLAIETLVSGLGSVVFCATKAQCEKLCRTLASNIWELGSGKKVANKSTQDFRNKLKTAIDFNKIEQLLQQLQKCPAGADPGVVANLRFGVAYHHAGLSIDERCIIEQAFRDGVIKILCATSTLSAGVNLPARLVIIRSPLDFKNSMMDVMSYRQMIGRAGRQGVDTMGESILMCSESNRAKGEELLKSSLSPISSCLMGINPIDGSPISDQSFGGIKRAILEIIANGMANNYEDVSQYIQKSFLASISSNAVTETIITDIIAYLVDEKLIHSMTDTDSQDRKITPTQFGKAVLASGVSPKDGAFILNELNKAKVSLCLSTDLHLLYEVTPITVSGQLESIDWQHFLKLWDKLDDDMRRVGKLVGVSENTLFSFIRKSGLSNEDQLLIHKRFYAALALHDLCHEVPLREVAAKYKCTKGMLQSLQQNASSYAGMLTTFCNRLGWHSLEVLIEQFQSRLFFGVQRELIDLMRITSLNACVARVLYNNKYDTVVAVANVDNYSDIELALMNSGPFDKSKAADASVVWLPALNKAMNVREMAKAMVFEARELINKDLGIKVYDLSQISSDGSASTGVGDRCLEDFTDESNDAPNNRFTKLVSPVKQTLSDTKENVDCVEREESVEDMSFVEESAPSVATNCDNNNSCDVSRSHPHISEPLQSMIVSPMDNINTSRIDQEELDANKPSTSKNVMSSTPIAAHHSSRSSRLRTVSEKQSENSFLADCDKPKVNEESSFDLGDSLDNISWDRLNCDLNKINESHNECEMNSIHDISMKNLSTISTDLLTKRCQSPDTSGDTLNSRQSDHSSKRSSSPSPSGKMMAERLNKRSHSSASDISNVLSDDSFPPFSDDSLDNKSDVSTNSSVVTKTVFNELKIGHKFTVSALDSTNMSSIDALLNKLVDNKTFCLHFKTQPKATETVRLIGSKIKALKKNNAPVVNGLDMRYNNTVITAIMIAFESESSVYYVSTDKALNKIRDHFRTKLGSDSKVVTFDVCLCYKVLKHCFGCDLQLLDSIDWFDVRIGHWILDPESKRPDSIQELVKIYCENYSLLFVKSKSNLETDCISTGLMFPLVNALMNELESKKQLKAFKRTEIPSRLVIADMELNGMIVDKDYMTKQLDLLRETKRQLEAKAYEISNIKFKLSSPTEIAKVLYEDMNLLSNYYGVVKKNVTAKGGANARSGRKLPKHLSTSKVALKKLMSLTTNPLPRVILDWRRVEYAIKTSIKPVMDYVRLDNDLQLHIINGLCDDWSSTGRISMHEPNLIGINKDFSVDDIDVEDNGFHQRVDFSLRKCFIARNGWQLVSADYSQLELRILAHLSKDRRLTQVLNSGGDVFKNIASVWKSKSVDDITADERQQSKQICYGMIYGKGEKSLAEDLEVTEEEAKEFMETFINRYDGVKRFISETIDNCRECGFVETLSGRRRYLPHILSGNSALRARAERQAVNSTIQGSAADLVKTAMAALRTRLLAESGIDCRFILQMHDELMYEVIDTCVDPFVHIMTECMENCRKNFSVELAVRVKTGPNWAQLQYIDSPHD